MMKIVGAIVATAITLTASTAFAGTNAVESAQKRIHAEWDKSRAQGGYGFPLTAIPAAIASAVNSAITGEDSRGQIAQGQKRKAQTN